MYPIEELCRQWSDSSHYAGGLDALVEYQNDDSRWNSMYLYRTVFVTYDRGYTQKTLIQHVGSSVNTPLDEDNGTHT